MAGFLFRLETVEGEPADPPTLSAAVPDAARVAPPAPRQGGCGGSSDAQQSSISRDPTTRTVDVCFLANT
jgi:hypothetical protein